MVRRCSCILLFEFEKAYGPFTIAPDETKALEVALGRNPIEMPKIQHTIDHMIDWGSRYLNLERVLGPGAVLVLGTEVAETT